MSVCVKAGACVWAFVMQVSMWCVHARSSTTTTISRQMQVKAPDASNPTDAILAPEHTYSRLLSNRDPEQMLSFSAAHVTRRPHETCVVSDASVQVRAPTAPRGARPSCDQFAEAKKRLASTEQISLKVSALGNCVPMRALY